MARYMTRTAPVSYGNRPTSRKQSVLDAAGNIVGSLDVWTHGIINASVRNPDGGQNWLRLTTTDIATAETEVRAEHARLVTEAEWFAKNPKADLERKLKSCDWYSDFSDDHSVWMRGNSQKDEIARLVKLVGAEGEAMHKAACPWLNGTDKSFDQKAA